MAKNTQAKTPADPLADMPADAPKETQADAVQVTTREQLIAQLFSEMKDPEQELANTLKAMGLKSDGKAFKAETAYSIAACWSWLDGGEVDNYEVLGKLWVERKDQVIEAYKTNGSSLAVQQQEAIEQSADFVDPGKSMQHALAEPAQKAYEAGLQITEIAAQRTAHNQKLTAQVMDAAFFEGVQDGTVEVKKPELPPLMTAEQAKQVLAGINRNLTRSNNSKSA